MALLRARFGPLGLNPKGRSRVLSSTLGSICWTGQRLPPEVGWLGPDQQKTVAGGNSVGVTPVPIPNTAVKPHRANGTAGLSGGRVRRRQLHLLTPLLYRQGGLFFLVEGVGGTPTLSGLSASNPQG